MTSFNHFLREQGIGEGVRSLMYHISRASKYINFSIRSGNTGEALTQNTFGETQITMDILSDKIIAEELKKSELVQTIASEEQEKIITFPSHRGKFFVAYDPLDGSSLVDTNLSIGSIFGIWENSDILGKPVGSLLVASCFIVYGPRITMTLAIKGKGVHEFELNDVGEFILSRENIKIKETSKCFAPGNLKVVAENPKYKNLMNYWLEEQKKLRYSGGMVPDLNHILSKGSGIFVYPADQKNENGKLRLLFECAPFGFLFEEAGGVAKTQQNTNILETIVTDYHQKTTIFIGSKSEVDTALSFFSA